MGHGNFIWHGDSIDGPGKILFRVGSRIQGMEDAAEEAECAAEVVAREGHAAEREAEVVAVGCLHGDGGVACGEHGFFDESGEQFEIGG